MNRALSALALLASAPAAAMAGSYDAAPAEPAIATPAAPVAPAPTGPAVGFTLRGGVSALPDYPGSEDYTVGPDLGFSLDYLEVGPLDFGSRDPYYRPEGVRLRGSFRYVPERDSSEYDAIEGLDDIDATVELGAGISYTAPSYEVFGDLRYGVNGHESLVAELGADAILRRSDRLTLSAGPRVLLGSDDYADTYFGVSAQEAAASGLSTYDAEGGVISAGVELGVTYDFNDDWGIAGAVTYDRLVGVDDSPIVESGSADQYGLRLGVTRRVTFGF